MAAQFRDARLKIKRANKHIADLERAILSLKESHTVTVQPNEQTGYQELIHMLKYDDAADDIALIAEDAVHNLKSALDFAWVSLLKKHLPSAGLDRAKFPIYPTRESLVGALNGIHINPTSNAAIFDLIVSDIQPYEEGKYGGVAYILHKLDIADKHLLPLGVHPLAGIEGIVVQQDDGEVIHGFGATHHPRAPSGRE